MTDEQQQLQMIEASAADFARANGGASRARTFGSANGAWDAAGWAEMAGLGWFGIAVPELQGGLGLGASAVAVVAEQAGRALMMQPLSAAMAGAHVLAAAGAPGEPTLSALLAGEAHVAMGHAEAAEADGTRIRLMPDGRWATHWLVSCGEAEHFSVRLLDMAQPGIVRRERAAIDGSVLVDADLDAPVWASSACLLQGTHGEAAWRQGVQLLQLADAAYLCGLSRSALQLAVDYLGVRRQFGVPIGSFQALQHRAADCHVDVTSSRSLVLESARAFGTRRGTWAAAAAIHRATETALHVTKEVVQFHGAIGYTDEHDAGLYLRRAMALSARHAQAALSDIMDDRFNAL